MASDIEVNWVDILNKFSSYQGTIVKFCNENGINPHQLYYQRKKASNTNPPLFHGIKGALSALASILQLIEYSNLIVPLFQSIFNL